MKSRRKFIKQTSLAIAGTALVSNKIFAYDKMHRKI